MTARAKPQAIKIERGALSCWVKRTTARGRHLSTSSFDVPAESYRAGNMTGARLALDLVRLVRRAPPDESPAVSWRMWETVCDAAAVPRGDGRHGAAVGFLHTMRGVLLGGILHTTSEAFAEQWVRTLESCHQQAAQREKDEAAAFAHRMKEARAAARQRAAVTHLAQWSGMQAVHEGAPQ